MIPIKSLEEILRTPSSIKIPKKPTSLTVEQIESIVFTKVGQLPYRLKKIEVRSPLQNVSGLMCIDGIYYSEVYE